MPSIPQSLLWISLVVLWLFVLVPMLISKRDAVRRTSDVALATRVLNTATGARLLKRGATGRRAPQRSGLAAVRRRPRRRVRRGLRRRDGRRRAAAIGGGGGRRHRGHRTRLPRRRRRRGGRRPLAGRRVGRRGGRRRRRRCRGTRRARRWISRNRGERRHRAVRGRDRRVRRPTGRHRRRVRVRRRLLGPGGAGGERSADGGLADGGAATPVRLDEGRGGERPQVQVPQADAGVDGRCSWWRRRRRRSW